MLSESALRAMLPIHEMGEPFRFYRTVTSTNDLAAEMARQGVGHGALVLADEQTSGRGRAGRMWFTPANSALAFSLVLRPEAILPQAVGGLAILGALAVVESLDKWTDCAMIKWPNDVLIDQRKTAGILVETSWMGDELEYAVMGIGVNVRSDSIPPASVIDYPATCVESAVGKAIDRGELLLDILAGVGRWCDRLDSPALQDAWQQRLAFRNQKVSIASSEGEVFGTLLGVTTDGKLRLHTQQGECIVAASGVVHMRSVDTHPKSATLDG